jgi:hypothetical protein
MRFTAIFFLFFIIQAFPIIAQVSSDPKDQPDAYTRLTKTYPAIEQISIYTDTLIIDNYYKHLLKNKQIKGVPGYRIRIFSESGLGAKDRQKRVRARFLSLYNDVDAYYSYDGLNFKVYVGDCRTRSEAAKLYERIQEDFPNAIVVRENINIEEMD